MSGVEMQCIMHSIKILKNLVMAVAGGRGAKAAFTTLCRFKPWDIDLNIYGARGKFCAQVFGASLRDEYWSYFRRTSEDWNILLFTFTNWMKMTRIFWSGCGQMWNGITGYYDANWQRTWWVYKGALLSFLNLFRGQDFFCLTRFCYSNN